MVYPGCRRPVSGNVHVFRNVRLGRRRITVFQPAGGPGAAGKRVSAPIMYHQQPAQKLDVVYESVPAARANPLERWLLSTKG